MELFAWRSASAVLRAKGSLSRLGSATSGVLVVAGTNSGGGQLLQHLDLESPSQILCCTRSHTTSLASRPTRVTRGHILSTLAKHLESKGSKSLGSEAFGASQLSRVDARQRLCSTSSTSSDLQLETESAFASEVKESLSETGTETGESLDAAAAEGNGNNKTQKELSKIFVTNLPYSCTESELSDFFRKQGEVINCRIHFRMVDGVRHSRGFASVEFADALAAGMFYFLSFRSISSLSFPSVTKTDFFFFCRPLVSVFDEYQREQLRILTVLSLEAGRSK